MASKQSSTATSSVTQNDQATQQQAQSRQKKNDRGMTRRDQYALMSPFAVLQRFIGDDIANLFGHSRQRPATTNGRAGTGSEMAPWAPNIDVVQRGNELVVRADLPGVPPDEVTVEVSDDAITLSGQRGEERVEDDGNVYRVERTFGAFFRTIPLPDGAMADQAKASFKDGVLEITVPAPPEQVSRGRRLAGRHGTSARLIEQRGRHFEQRPIAEDRALLDDVLQLPDVARPAERPQPFERRWLNSREPPFEPAVRLVYEMLGERGNVGRAFASGGRRIGNTLRR